MRIVLSCFQTLHSFETFQIKRHMNRKSFNNEMKKRNSERKCHRYVSCNASIKNRFMIIFSHSTNSSANRFWTLNFRKVSKYLVSFVTYYWMKKNWKANQNQCRKMVNVQITKCKHEPTRNYYLYVTRLSLLHVLYAK